MAKNIIVNILRQGIIKSQPFTILEKRGISHIIYNEEGGNNETSIPNAPGLSTAVHTNEEPVGPGASKTSEYKVPEYYNFNKTSYFEAEIEIAKYRCPQPSAIKKK